MTILLVDDDQDDVYIFREAINAISPEIKCIHAQDGIEAVELLKDAIVDIIFLDLNMPRMDGKECLTEIRNNDALRNIPIIIYSTAPEMIEAELVDKFGIKTLKKDVSYLNTVVTIRQRLSDLRLFGVNGQSKPD
jgi:CheY-like chemotaxis protein